MTANSTAASSLAGNVALITGASRGIGFAIAERLADAGARIAICARDAGALEAARSRLISNSPFNSNDIFAMPADVASPAQVSALVEKTLAHFGAIDFLINNAGTSRFGPVHECTESDWDTVLDTNLKGVFLASRAVLPGMISRRRGHIVNISSLAGKNSFAGGSLYCASKWGLLGLTYCMAEDVRSYGIRVSAICPGSVATDFGHPPLGAAHKPSLEAASKELPQASHENALREEVSREAASREAAPHEGALRENAASKELPQASRETISRENALRESVSHEKDRSKMLQPSDVAHAVEMVLTAAPQSFISEVLLRPTQKP